MYANFENYIKQHDIFLSSVLFRAKAALGSYFVLNRAGIDLKNYFILENTNMDINMEASKKVNFCNGRKYKSGGGGGLKLNQYVCTLLVPCSLSHKIRGISRKTKNIKLIKGEKYKKKLLVVF